MATGRHNSYVNEDEIGLLFIEPIERPTKQPLIDKATRLMACALRLTEPKENSEDLSISEIQKLLADSYMGKHKCSCGVCDDARTRRIGKFRTNSLCVHYLAFHREEVPSDELEDVLTAFQDEVEPTEKELVTPPKIPIGIHVSEQKTCPRCEGNERICMSCASPAPYCLCKMPYIRPCRMCHGSGLNPRYKK